MGRDGITKGIALNAFGNLTECLRDSLQEIGRKKGKADSGREV